MSIRFPSLRIEGFRVFRELSVEGLGDVNLVTGRNNVGKTALLEAVQLLSVTTARFTLVHAIAELLARHGEFLRDASDPAELSSVRDARRLDTRALFRGRPSEPSPASLFTLSSPDPAAARLRVNWRRKADLVDISSGTAAIAPGSSARVLAIEASDGLLASLDDDALVEWLTGQRDPRSPPLVPANGIAPEVLTAWWDAVALTDAEAQIVACLNLAAPIERIALVDAGGGRVPFVRPRGEREPVPLRALGEGMGRLFSFALAAQRAQKSGVLLIDEIENGVHYSVLPDLWRFLFATARANGVQVFATTHSWDCIAAFAEVSAEDKESVGALVRLREKQGDIVPTVFTEQDLAVVERQHLEVR